MHADRRYGRRIAIAAVTVACLLVIAVPAALAADGDLATAFNGTGKLSSGFGGFSSQINGEVVQADGKLVVVGSNDADGAVARINPDGALDPSFGGGDGIAPFDSGTAAGGEEARGVAIQPDGKILVIGDATLSGGTTVFVVARYNPDDGALDASFDGPGAPGDGIFRISGGAGTTATGTAIAASGTQIVFAGTVDAHSNVYQLNGDGSLDSGFNSTGHMTFDFPGGFSQSFLSGVTIQPGDGKIIVVGNPNTIGAGMGVARITTAGALDTATFGGSNGYVVLPPPTGYVGGQAAKAIVDPATGEILVGGSLYFDDCPTCNLPPDPAIAAVTPAGSLDTAGFGSGGTAGYAVLPFPSRVDRAMGIARQPDGKLLIGGFAETSTPFVYQGFAARFSATGVLDTSFGAPNGYVFQDFGASTNIRGFALSNSGVAYLGGAASSTNFGVIALQAYPVSSSSPSEPGTSPPAPVASQPPITTLPKKKCKKGFVKKTVNGKKKCVRKKRK